MSKRTTKTIEDRIADCIMVRQKMAEHNIPVPDEFKAKTNEYIKYDVPVSGSIWIPELKKNFVYAMSCKKKNPPQTALLN